MFYVKSNNEWQVVQASLNTSQELAVNTYDAPLLILAGAGTGKTMTITARIANLILNNVAFSDQILAVTFTNKAAGEMKTRIEKIVGAEASKMWVGTFHSISARILRMYSKSIGLEPNFLILDEYDRKKLVTQIIHDLDIDEKRFPAKICQFVISSLKEKCIDPDDSERIATFKYRELDIEKLYQTYQSRLRGMNAVDFDDLIFEVVRLFKREPKILADLQNRFRFITVDEYQDTNELQHLWLRLIAGSNANVCCVGDEDQSIYGWRGARVDYILHFEDDFPGAKIIRLEQNYRSTQLILEAAMSVIANNKQRYNKTLSSNISSVEKPKLVFIESDRDENNNIIKNIINLQQNKNVSYKNIAILVRATHQMRSIEDCFIKNSVPYKIIGGIKFYDRKEIKDMIAYVRWCYSLTDEISLERIINLPKRGIGDKTFADAISYIKQNNQKLFDGLEYLASFGNGLLSKAAIAGLQNFVAFTKRTHKMFEDKQISLAEIVENIYFNSGYSLMLQEEMRTDAETASKIDNIKEFISSIQQFSTIDEFLEHISLVSASDDDTSNDAVNIMTMHASKGLEFDYVFLPAWEEGVFPSQKSLDENGNQGVEEERRLAYVALTRARKNFYVYSAKQRMQFGKVQLCQPSRFVNEMSDKLQIIDLRYNYSFNNAIHSGNITSKYNPMLPTRGKQMARLSNNHFQEYENNYNSKRMPLRPISPYAKIEPQKLKVGDSVYNEKFGEGVIVKLYGKVYEVQFNNTKQLTSDVVPFVKIKTHK